MKSRSTEQPAENTESQSDWVKTPDADLVRYKPSGIYFAPLRIRGKLFRHSLKTDVISVAKLRLGDFIRDRREEMGDDSVVHSGRMTVGDAIGIFRQRLDGQQDIKEGAKVYRRKCIDALLKSWPDLEKKPVGKVSKEDCLEWSRKLAAKYSASVCNNTVGTLRMILDVAIEKGARALNPAKAITKRRIQPRELQLPEPEQFDIFVESIGDAGAWCSRDSSDLVRFLAYGGFRKTEAANITWNDCEFSSGRIQVRVTKNGSPRSVPMIQDMKALLDRLKNERPGESLEMPVMRVRECQKAMDRAAKIVVFRCKEITEVRGGFSSRSVMTPLL